MEASTGGGEACIIRRKGWWLVQGRLSRADNAFMLGIPVLNALLSHDTNAPSTTARMCLTIILGRGRCYVISAHIRTSIGLN